MTERAERYVAAAIDSEIEVLASTGSGRNAALNKAAFALGGFVAAGAISEDVAYERLIAACEANGYARKDGWPAARSSIRSGLRAGYKQPRELPRDVANDVRQSRPGPLTVVTFAAHKRLSVDALRFYGWRDTDRGIEIPYVRRDGTAARTRLRGAIDGAARFRWQGDGEIIAYDPDQGELARKLGHLVVCEGESDTISLLFAGVPALGIPGADMTRTIQAHHLEGVSRVFIAVDVNVVGAPDSGAEKFIPRVRARLAELGFGKK